MRVRLVIELALHEQMYLDNDYLAKGCPDAQDVAVFCCIYSEQYVSSRRGEEGNQEQVGIHLDTRVCKNRHICVYVGKKQLIFALA